MIQVTSFTFYYNLIIWFLITFTYSSSNNQSSLPYIYALDGDAKSLALVEMLKQNNQGGGNNVNNMIPQMIMLDADVKDIALYSWMNEKRSSTSQQPTNILKSTRVGSQPTSNWVNPITAMAMKSGSSDTQQTLAAISMLTNGAGLKDPLVISAVMNNNGDSLENYLAYQMAVAASKPSSTTGSDPMMAAALLSGDGDFMKSEMQAALISGNGQADPVVAEGLMLDGDAKDFANASIMNQLAQGSGTNLNPAVMALLMEGDAATALAYQNAISGTGKIPQNAQPVVLQSARVNSQPMNVQSQTRRNQINPMTMYALDGDAKDLAMIEMMQNQGGNMNSMLPQMMLLDGDFKDLALVEMMANNNRRSSRTGSPVLQATSPTATIRNRSQRNEINPMMMYAFDGDYKDLAMMNMIQNQGGNTNAMLPEMMMFDGDFKDLAMMEMLANNNNQPVNTAGIPRTLLQSTNVNSQPVLVGQTSSSFRNNQMNPMVMAAMDGDVKDYALINMMQNQGGLSNNVLPEMMMFDGDFKDLAMIEMLTNNNQQRVNSAGIPRLMLQSSQHNLLNERTPWYVPRKQ